MSPELDVDGIVRSWLDAGPMALPDHVQDAVLDQLPATPQRRARRPAWRLHTMITPFRLAATAAVIGIFAATVNIAPMATGPGTPEQADPSPVASSAPVAPAALVTGTITKVGEDFVESSDVAFGIRQRGRDYTGQVTMSDPRLSGDVIATDHADRFCDGVCDEDTFRADLLWGTIEIANDDGTWIGTSVNTTDISANGAGVTYYELSGTGAYEGQSAVLFETEEFPGPIFNLSGVIFPGELPPDR